MICTGSAVSPSVRGMLLPVTSIRTTPRESVVSWALVPWAAARTLPNAVMNARRIVRALEARSILSFCRTAAAAQSLHRSEQVQIRVAHRQGFLPILQLYPHVTANVAKDAGN